MSDDLLLSLAYTVGLKSTVHCGRRAVDLRPLRGQSRDTRAELKVRALLRPLAPSYRLNRGDLPGKPDLVYFSRKLAIFVHGSFWHGHDCARSPKTNADYWRTKIERNRARDERTLPRLQAMGWRALVVFECELKDKPALIARLGEALRLE